MPESTLATPLDRFMSLRPGSRPRSISCSSGRTLAGRSLSGARIALLAFGLIVLFGCDRNIEPFEPGETPSAPDLARIFPDAPSGPGSAAPAAGGTAGTRGNASGGPARSALPPSRAEGSATAAATAAAGAAPISGQILLAPELVDSRPGGGILFVIARPQGARGGPPLAVLRIPDPRFPLDFTIGPENVMIPSMRFEGAISLSARLDADGNAMTRGAGDISSETQEPLAPGADGVELLLSKQG